MNELLQHLIEALREELKQYGEMLALLDHQHHLAAHDRSKDLLQSVHATNAQAEALQVARGEREQRRRRVAREARLHEESNFAALIPKLPAPYQPLVQALVQENTDLFARVEQRACQNQLLLTRAREAAGFLV